MNLRKSLLLASVIVILCGGGLLVSGQSPSPQGAVLAFPSGSQSCTSFCLDDTGGAVFGANFDNDDYDGLLFVNKRNVSKMGWETGPNGERAVWVSQYGNVTFNLAGYQFAWAGMNEAGLMMSTMRLGGTQNPAPDNRPPLASPVWMQYLLDTCATIDDVLATDDDVRVTPDNVDHFLVCDRTATCAVIEFLHGKRVVHTGAELPISALTNHTYTESLETWQAYSGESVETEWSSSLGRFIRAANQVQDFTPQGDSAVDYAFETLDIVSNSSTRWSIVFDAENLDVHFRTWNHPAIRSLSFDDLDFSCQTPVRMTKIKTELSGNIADDLVDYDHDISLTHFVDFLDAWGIAIPESQADQLMRLMEGYSCEE